MIHLESLVMKKGKGRLGWQPRTRGSEEGRKGRGGEDAQRTNQAGDTCGWLGQRRERFGSKRIVTQEPGLLPGQHPESSTPADAGLEKWRGYEEHP